MQRVTITLDDELMAALDHAVLVHGYQNRSEAVRDLARAGLARAAEGTDGNAACVGALVYVYDHEARELPKRLTRSLHDHHHLALATMHVHLDHESCLEVTVFRGKSGEVRHVADHIIAERGVRHGQLVTVPVAFERQKHPHGAEPGQQHLHVHVREAR